MPGGFYITFPYPGNSNDFGKPKFLRISILWIDQDEVFMVFNIYTYPLFDNSRTISCLVLVAMTKRMASKDGICVAFNL